MITSRRIQINTKTPNEKLLYMKIGKTKNEPRNQNQNTAAGQEIHAHRI